MKTFTAHATRWEHGWELAVDGVGATQSHGLPDAETMVRDLVTRRLGIDPAEISVELDVHVEDIVPGVEEARRAVEEAAEAQRIAAERSRAVARALVSAGLSGRDVAKVLHVSPQRVSQLVNA